MISPTVRSLWLVIVTLTAMLVAATSGLLAWIGGLNLPTAVLTGGGAFGGTVLLALSVLRFYTSAPE